MSFDSAPRIAITGYGCVTALGSDSITTWNALLEGRSVRAPITAISLEGCRVTEGAQAILPELSGYTAKQLSRLSRASRLLLPAATEALGMASLLDDCGHSRLKRLELSISTTACGMEKGENFLDAIWQVAPQGQTARVAHYQAQQQISELHRHFEFTGPAMIVANACAGGGNAIGHAADLIRCGMADCVLAGGYDALCELVFAGFDSLQSLAPEACRPFDQNRRGLMLGEGAGFLVLENEQKARSRKAHVLGVVAGYGHSTDRGHLTQPEQEGLPLEQAMKQALAQAQLPASSIGYINAHGTGTLFNDKAEAKAFARLFTPYSTRVSSTKAATGHTLGAAGAIEAIISLLALNTGHLPPQLNVLNPEPIIADFLVPNIQQAPSTTLQATMSVNLGFGGSNAALIFTKP